MVLKYPQSVLIGDVVFVAGWESHDVLKYETRSDQWSVLPSLPVESFGLGQLSGKLVTVGGVDRSAHVGDVYTYEEETQQQWEKSIPPMPTPRSDPVVFTYHSTVAVCGGYGGDRVVEVFNIESSQWYTVAPLPVACEGMHVTIINDTCYVGGGGGGWMGSRSIMCASLPGLLQSTTPHNQVWTMLPDLSHYYSALTNMGGILLALGGGEDSSVSRSEDIHAYCPNTKTWMKIGSLPQACDSATAELLPSGELILIEEWEIRGKCFKNVYIGSLQLQQN